MSFFSGLFGIGSKGEKDKEKAFKTTMRALEETGVPSIRRTLSKPLPGEGSKPSLSSMMQEQEKGDLKVPGQTPSERGGGKKRRKSRRKRRKSRRKKRRKSRRNRNKHVGGAKCKCRSCCKKRKKSRRRVKKRR